MGQVSDWRKLGRVRTMLQHVLDVCRQPVSLNDTLTREQVRGAAELAAELLPENDARQSLLLADAYISLMAKLDKREASSPQTREELQKGAAEAAYILSSYIRDFAEAAVADHDFFTDKAEVKRQRRRQLWLILGCIVAGIAILAFATWIWRGPWLSERRAFDKLQQVYQDRTVSLIDFETLADNYLKDFPDGAHEQEVRMMEIEYMILNPEYSPVGRIEDYLDKYPGGTYAKRCEALYDSLWNVEIKKFDKYAAGRPDTEGLRFMKGMLAYMKANRLSVIQTDIKGEVEVKEYSAYPESIRRYLERNQKFVVNDGIGYQPELPSDVETIKKSFDDDFFPSMDYVLEDKFRQRFDSVFTPGFIRFGWVDAAESKIEKMPLLKMDCRLANQPSPQLGPTYPAIWVYRRAATLLENPSLIMGLDLSMTTSLSYPGAPAPLQLTCNEGMTEQKTIDLYISDSEPIAPAVYGSFTREALENTLTELLKALGMK